MGQREHDRQSDVRFVRRYAQKLEKQLGLNEETDRERAYPGQSLRKVRPSRSFLLIREHLKTLPDHLAASTLGRLVISLGGNIPHGEDWITETYLPNRSRLDILMHEDGLLSTQGPPGYGMLLDLAACAILGARKDLITEKCIQAFKGGDFSGVWYHQIERAWNDMGRRGSKTSFIEDKFSHRSAAFRQKLRTLEFHELPRHLRVFERKMLVDALKALIG